MAFASAILRQPSAVVALLTTRTAMGAEATVRMTQNATACEARSPRSSSRTKICAAQRKKVGSQLSTENALQLVASPPPRTPCESGRGRWRSQASGRSAGAVSCARAMRQATQEAPMRETSTTSISL